ncbi:MAG: 4a-hydroxytetrahydrobiopterin dehydratase [Mycobacteriales bacterium]
MILDRVQRYAPLDVEALAAALGELPGWRCDGTRLIRTVVPHDLWALLEQVCAVEGELDHHTEVTLDAGTVTFLLWTHVRDAVTLADVELARRLDLITEELGLAGAASGTTLSGNGGPASADRPVQRVPRGCVPDRHCGRTSSATPSRPA